ncbi:MAG: hypothetical protein ABI548_23700 [Polyangiaceae bacterium]
MAHSTVVRALPLALSLLSLDCIRKIQASVPGAQDRSVSATCGNGAQFHNKPYTWENNQWGSGKEHSSYQQCLLERDHDAETQHGWSWIWPGTDTSVFAYPEIIFGWKPWTGGRSSDQRFPMKLSDMQRLKIHYDVETEANGSYNLAPEVWIISHRSSAGAPDPKLITAEIMFWQEAAGEARPAGTVVDRPEVGGITYELWQKDNAGDNGAGGWRLLSFKTPTTIRAGTVPVDDLLRYLLKKGLIAPEQYIATVEFGNEISGGSGTTWVKKFAVEVSP